MSAAAGIAVFLAFPKFGLIPTVFLFPVIFHFLSRRFQSAKEAFLNGFIISFFVMLGGFYWVTYVIHVFGYLSWPVSFLIFLVFAGLGALNFPLFAAAVFKIEQRFHVHETSGRLRDAWYVLAAPALYTLIEYLFPKLFPWYLGHCFYSVPIVIQISEITGSIFLSFLVVSTGGLLYLAFRRWRHHELRPGNLAIAFPIAAWIVVLTFGAVRLNEAPPTKTIRFGLIQANIGSLEKVAARKGLADKVRLVIDTYKGLTSEALGRSPAPEIVLWPETAMPFQLEHEHSGYSPEIRRAVQGWGVPLITGAYSASPFDFSRDYNSAYLLDPLPDGKLRVEKYHKNILLAFGEYMPLGEQYPSLYRLFPSVSNFERGRTQDPFTLRDGTRLGVTVCYEAIVPSFYRKVMENQVQAVVNLTNDSWFGPTAEPYLHGALSVFRAVEFRAPLIRVTNTGVSFTVDDRGRRSPYTGVYQSGILISEVPIPAESPATFYFKFGDWFVGLALLFLGGYLTALYRKKDASLSL